MARKSPEDPLKMALFMENALIPKINGVRRRRGRPKVSWAAQVYSNALKVSEGRQTNLEQLVMNEVAWRNKVKSFMG